MFRNSKNKETDFDTVVEAESKYSLFNLSTFAEKATTRQNYRSNTLYANALEILISQQNCSLFTPYGADWEKFV